MAEDVKGIFISYRRDESAAYAGRMADGFTEHFGKNRVFRDIDSIEPGLDFAEAIERAVDSSEVLIAVIGRNWLTATDAAGHKRLENPDDYVRMEIGAALQRNIRVIPVLVQGAAMPRADELPDDLAPLARRNAFALHDTGWREGVQHLITRLDRVLGRNQVGPTREREHPSEVEYGVFSPVDRLPLWQYALGLCLVSAVAFFSFDLGVPLTSLEWDSLLISAAGYVIIFLGLLSSAVVFGWWVGVRLRNPRFRSRITVLALLVGVAFALVHLVYSFRILMGDYGEYTPITSFAFSGGFGLLGAVCFVSSALVGNVRRLRRTARITGATPASGLRKQAILGWSIILIMGALSLLAIAVLLEAAR